ncbi:MAG: hypothetical protein GXO80_01450 [Chlorobi bacterium]|nr:hypothetical protein [Chlorobiota bacterium]
MKTSKLSILVRLLPIILLPMFLLFSNKSFAQSSVGRGVNPIAGDLHRIGGNIGADSINRNTTSVFSQNFTKTDPVFTSAAINNLWQENSEGNIYRNKGYVGIRTENPDKPLEIFSVYNLNAGSLVKKSTIRLTNLTKSYEEPKNKGLPGPNPTPPKTLYKWDIENDNDSLKLKFIYYDLPLPIGTNATPKTKFTFSGNGTFTATKFVGDGSGLTNVNINEPIILNDGITAWTNNGWSPRLQSLLGTVWASTNKSNLGNYYLGLGMTNSGWYFMNRYDNGDFKYVTVIREDGRIQCKEVTIFTNEWKDNVFNKDYKLPTIEETEQYINNYGHLPDIPSEKEIVKNGMETSELIKLQMQKIEELTLYIIEQNKRIKKLEQKINTP